MKASKSHDQPVTFAQLAAGSVNRQVMEVGLPNHIEESGLLAIGDRSDATATSNDDGVIVPAADSISEQGRIYKRAVPAPALHRTDWIAEHLATDPNFQWATVEAWRDWRNDWALLTDEVKTLYALQAGVVKSFAKHNLRALPPLPLGDGVVNEDGGAIVPAVTAVAHSSPPAPQAIKANWMLSCASTFMLCENGMWSDAMSSVVAKASVADTTVPLFALDPSLLHCLVLKGGGRKPTLGPLEKYRGKFGANSLPLTQGVHNTYEAFTDHSQRLPQKVHAEVDRVDYAPGPVALDPGAAGVTVRQIGFQKNIMACFERLATAGPRNKPKNVVAGDVFVAFQLALDDPLLPNQPVMFAHFTDATAAAGKNVAIQYMFRYMVVEEADDGGIIETLIAPIRKDLLILILIY